MTRLEERLLIVADACVLSTSQFAVLAHISTQVARRWLRQLEQEGLVDKSPAPLAGKRGRCEQCFSVTKEGFERLRTLRALRPGLREEANGGAKDNVVHQLLLNGVRAALVRMESYADELTSRFIPFNSPLRTCPPVRHNIALDARQLHHRSFEPDAVIALSARQRASLFYLEVDCGTESLLSPSGNGFADKIVNYTILRGTGTHRHWEDHFGPLLSGFRVLIVTRDRARQAQLARLLRNFKHARFFWTAPIELLERQRAGAKIWAQGTRTEPECSLLGSLLES